MLIDNSTQTGSGSEAQPTVQVFMLGGFRIVVDGRPLPDGVWRRKKARQLFKCLLGRRNRRLSREDVTELLWPESDPETGSSNVRSAIHAMRRALGETSIPRGLGMVFADRDSVWLRPDLELWVDTDAFERAIDEARHASDPQPLLEKASALYAGDYLPEDLYDDWANERRETLKRAWTDLQFQLSQAYEKYGNADAASRPLRHLLQVDRCDERAAQQLMRLLASFGQRSEAMRVYERLVEALRSELGVEPSEDVVALQHQIAIGDVHHELAMATAAFRCIYPFPTPTELIGRDAELAVLERVLAAGRTAGQAVLIGAPAGTGKSALVGRLVERAAQQGMLCLAGGCYEERGLVPLGPFHDALVDFLLTQPADRLRADLRDCIDDLAQVIPELSYQMKMTPGLQADAPRLDRVHVFGAIHALLRKLAERGPVLLCVEDLHAADAASIQLFHYLVRQTRRVPLVLVGTYRDDDPVGAEAIAQLLSSLVRERIVEQIVLAPLDRSDTARLASFILGGAVTETARDSLHDATGGNPLFIEHLIPFLSDGGQLQLRTGMWQTATGIKTTPPIVREVMAERIARLGSSCRELLAMASVLGQTMDYGVLLATLQPIDETGVLQDLDEAIAASVLVETAKGYAFRHALLRDAVYSGLSAPRRMLLHTRVGETLEARAGSRAADEAAALAYHFARAGHATVLRTKALQYSLEAGRRADALSAHHESLRHFRCATELIESGAPETTFEAYLNALEGQGRAERELTLWPAAVDTFRRVLELSNEPIRRARVRGEITSALLHDDTRQALAEAQAGLAELEGLPGVPEAALPRLHLQTQLALILFLEGRYLTVLDVGKKMRAEALGLPEPRPHYLANTVIAWGHMGLGHVADAKANYQRALNAAELTGYKAWMAIAHTNIGIQNYLCGEFDDARNHLHRAVELYRESAGDLPAAAVNALQNLGRVALAEGDLSQAQDHAERALALAIEGQIRWAADCHDMLGAVLALRSEWDAAQASYEEAIRTRKRVGYAAGIIESLLGLGLVHLYRGDCSLSEQIYKEALAVAETMDACPQVAATLRQLGRLHLLMGEMDQAADEIGRALELTRDMHETLEYGPTLLAAAELAHNAGDLPAALDAAQQALGCVQSLEQQIETRALLATLYMDVGTPQRAEPLIDVAVEMAERLGAPRLLDLVRKAADQLDSADGGSVLRPARPVVAD